ncbi:hypothetical protein BDW75DRAFT_234825 [Aspergillus navahoensis]
MTRTPQKLRLMVPGLPCRLEERSSDANATLTGTCPCGSISITVTESDLSLRNDQGSTSSLVIDASKTVIQGRRNTLKMYFDLDMSGRQMEKFFCSSCGSPVISMITLLPGRVNLTMGLTARIPTSALEARTTALQPLVLPHRHSHSAHGKLDDAVQWGAKANAGLA